MQAPADKPSSHVAPYDLDVVDEAVVNAVAHRDYAISGSKIRLFLFADRLELYSPGKLPNTITLDDMPYRTFTRNQLLVSFLSRIRSRRTGQVFLESRGEGARKILQDGEAHAGRRPVYAVRRRASADAVARDPFDVCSSPRRWRTGYRLEREGVRPLRGPPVVVVTRTRPRSGGTEPTSPTPVPASASRHG